MLKLMEKVCPMLANLKRRKVGDGKLLRLAEKRTVECLEKYPVLARPKERL